MSYLVVKARAYVAMVLCQETEYVLLDEPLNNLGSPFGSNDGTFKKAADDSAEPLWWFARYKFAAKF